jgi:hypothetical protein
MCYYDFDGFCRPTPVYEGKMATREDIEEFLTLEFAGDVSPADFQRIVEGFFKLVQGVEVAGEDISWAVKVKKGSQLVGVRPTSPTIDGALVSRTVAEGISLLEQRVQMPRGFTEDALRGLRTIAKASENPSAPRLWAGFVSYHVSQRVANNVSELLEGKVAEYGSVSGKLETVSERNGFRFIVYDALWDHPVHCHIKEKDIARVMEAFGRRVEVFGQVHYRHDGRATSVEVEDFAPFPTSEKLPTLNEVRGILKNYRRKT